MKAIIAACLLSVCTISQAELHEKTVKVMCGTAEEFNITIGKFEEAAVLYANMKDDPQQISYGVFVNFKTGTSSWVAHLMQSDEYCMVGIGDRFYIPKSSPLKDTPIGTKTKFK